MYYRQFATNIKYFFLVFRLVKSKAGERLWSDIKEHQTETGLLCILLVALKIYSIMMCRVCNAPSRL